MTNLEAKTFFLYQIVDGGNGGIMRVEAFDGENREYHDRAERLLVSGQYNQYPENIADLVKKFIETDLSRPFFTNGRFSIKTIPNIIGINGVSAMAPVNPEVQVEFYRRVMRSKGWDI